MEIPKVVPISCAGTDISATGDTVVGEAVVLRGECTRMQFHVAVATQGLDNFDVEIQHSSGGPWSVLVSDWSTPETGVVKVETDLAALAAAADAWAVIEIYGAWAIRFKASAAVNGAAVTILGVAY